MVQWTDLVIYSWRGTWRRRLLGEAWGYCQQEDAIANKFCDLKIWGKKSFSNNLCRKIFMVKRKKNHDELNLWPISKSQIVTKLKSQRCDMSTFIICVDFFLFIRIHHCSKTIKARELKFMENVNLSPNVTCNVSPVTCHESCVN